MGTLRREGESFTQSKVGKRMHLPRLSLHPQPSRPDFPGASAAPCRTPGICKLLQHLWPQEGALQTPCPRFTFPSCGPGGLSERIQVCTQEGKVYGCLKDRAGQGRAGVTRGHQGSLSGPREWCLCVCVCVRGQLPSSTVTAPLAPGPGAWLSLWTVRCHDPAV